MKKLESFAELDWKRAERTGIAEAVFCQGKQPVQVAEIIRTLAERSGNVIGTRATREDYRVTRQLVPETEYFEEAGILAVIRDRSVQFDGTVAVLTAGTADLPVAEEAAVTAELMGHRVDRIYDVGVAGVHRLLNKIERIRKSDVVIAVAGMEGALASVVAGLVEMPVIAVPSSVGYGASFHGLSSLLTMLNSCAPGIGVVNIDNGYGAACLMDKIRRAGERRKRE